MVVFDRFGRITFVCAGALCEGLFKLLSMCNPLSRGGLRQLGNWVQGLDLNQRPSGYEPDELPGCSTLQRMGGRGTLTLVALSTDFSCPEKMGDSE